MRQSALFTPIVAILLTSGARSAELPLAKPNPNTAAAGIHRNGVLSVTLEARLAMWHPDGDSLAGIPVEAFGEAGKPPQVPGPLIRANHNTELDISVKNSLESDTLTYFVETGGIPDSIVVPPGATGRLRLKPARAGNFLYRATTSSSRFGWAFRVGGLLAGAVVIDSAGAVGASRDHILVLQVTGDTEIGKIGIPSYPRSVFALNGRSWPHTERLDATVGDTVHWRIINATNDIHPMHLHGFYYSVDEVEDLYPSRRRHSTPKRRVVTERLTAFSTMSMSWVPERAGNWLFHCHFADHLVPHGALSGATPTEGAPRIGNWRLHPVHSATANHTLTGMAGLITGITVHPRSGARPIAEAAANPRRLRLIAIQDPEYPDSTPSMRFVLEDRHASRFRTEAWPGLSPTITLVRGEPIAITVVNQLREPTSVHWHGIELESYFDGVAGYSGTTGRLSPIIAPADSFEARFTPPRSGTFMYHSHVDELRQQRAGLVGALLVSERDAESVNDIPFLFKSARYTNTVSLFEINGQLTPDTLTLRAGQKYRLRLIAIHNDRPTLTASITARADSVSGPEPDSLLRRWLPVAKDGADLAAAAMTLVPARQAMSMGEIYDFEFVAEKPGNLRLELRTGGRLMARTPIRVF